VEGDSDEKAIPVLIKKILADENALLTYLNTRTRLPRPGEIGCCPKQALKNLFKMHGREYLQRRDAPEIFQEADIDAISGKNQSFEYFRKRVIDP